MITDRDELLRREEAAWAEFVAEVGRVPEHRRSEEGVVPGWSVNDLLFHCGRWAVVATEHLEAMRTGVVADKGEDDDPTDTRNARWAEESKSMAYEDAMASALADREGARQALMALPAVDDVASSWFTEETYDHYQEHTEEISRFADSLGVPEK
jgi:Mycothiol maleylpyruvate isomerase N-terminal domain